MAQTLISGLAGGAKKPGFATLRAWPSASPLFMLAMGFVVLAAISAATVWFIERAHSDAEWIAHTLEVQNRLSNLKLQMRRSESAMRAYLLTNDSQFLKNYQSDAKALIPSVDGIAGATNDNPHEQALVTELRPLIGQSLNRWRQIVRLHDAGDTAGSAALVRSQSHAATEFAVIDRMFAEEARLFTVRKAASARSGNWLFGLAIVGAVVIIALAAMSYRQMRRSGRELQVAHSELKEVNANLETLVDQRSGHLREANEEIQRFAYIVSHDLRSPLVNIMGFTSELDSMRKSLFARITGLRQQIPGEKGEGDQALDGEFGEALGFIKSSIARMDRLINTILKLAREGKRRLKPEAIDMTRLLGQICESVQHQVQEAGVTIELDRLPNIRSDRLALEQVFSNLIDNAVKYLRADAPGRIEIVAAETPTTVSYKIRDNGRGIDPKDKDRIFDLFRRSGPQDRPGEGVGLAHTRALVRRVGGSINVESQLGQGSEFRVTLPKRWSESEMTT